MAQVVFDKLDPQAGVQQVHGDGVAQRMDRILRVDASLCGVVLEQPGDALVAQGALPAGEQPSPVGRRTSRYVFKARFTSRGI